MREVKIWTTGRRGCVTCVIATVYENAIVATAESDQITPRQMKKALGREFPGHAFNWRKEDDFTLLAFTN